ncbi:MAG TPA: DUF2933 domain-containing protein [Nanoarchaeota archaeon]|nr:DUF2933 domain-containing protein [Nanoarchaeota archaeon]
MGAWEKIRQNHMLLMAVCCGLPVIGIYAAVYFFGVSKSYIFWAFLIICPLMHYFMMKDMHSESNEGKKKGGCH